ncbi:hypothetical protein, partial [Escherichia coli]|uniref:hypothetical protein n=1 Tax=Escherichia coli TaxID=562 RepID=UPI0013D5976D
GDLERLDELVEEAQEGVFDIRQRGAASRCQLVNDIVQGRFLESEFPDLVKSAARITGSPASRSSILRNAATSFWRALAHIDE